MKNLIFLGLSVMVFGCAHNTSDQTNVENVDQRKPAEELVVSQDLNLLRGKLLQLVEISNLRLSGKGMIYEGSCTEDQIKVGFRNDLIRFGNDEASIIPELGVCNKINFNMLQVYPSDNNKVMIIIGNMEGYIAGLFSRKETDVELVNYVSFEVSCSVVAKHKASVFGFLKYVATSELSTSEQYLECNLPKGQGKISYRVIE